MKNWKNILVIFVTTFALALVSYAGSFGSFSASSSNGDATGATAIIPPGNGALLSTSLTLDVSTNGTLTIDRPSARLRAHDGITADTNLVVWGQGTRTANINGSALTTSDRLIVQSSGSDGLQVAGIAAIVTNGVDTNGYFTIQTSDAVTILTNNAVYVAIDTDKVQIPVLAADSPIPFAHRFTGFVNMPVALRFPESTGGSVISGTYSRE